MTTPDVVTDPAATGMDASGVFSGQTLEIARREAVVEAGDPEAVGEFIDAYYEGENVVTARFSAFVDGYHGWQWSVTVALVDPDHPTVSEVMLLPGSEALLAPAWVPWKERVRGGDLSVGDLLPPAPDDERIVPAYVQSDDPAVEELAFEVGLGRVRVLSREGRIEAATRWHAGEFGPDDEMARHAPGNCITCAFYLPLAGSLGVGFGVCGNEFSPADGRVVDLAYGCGAHSEVAIPRSAAAATGDVVIDELTLEVHLRDGGASVDDGVSADGLLVDEGVSADDDVAAEDLLVVDEGALADGDVLSDDDLLVADDGVFVDDEVLADDELGADSDREVPFEAAPFDAGLFDAALVDDAGADDDSAEAEF